MIKEIWVMVFCLFLFSCGSENFKKENINGIETISYAFSDDWPKRYKIVLEEKFSIEGKIEKTGNLYKFGRLTDYIVEDDFYLIHDYKEHSVFKFDLKGKLVKTYDYRGNGPGENPYTGSLLKYKNYFGIKVSNPSRVILLDNNLNFIKDHRAENEFASIIRSDKTFEPLFVKTMENLGIKNKKNQWRLIFHRFSDLNLKEDVFLKYNYSIDAGEKIDGVYYMDYGFSAKRKMLSNYNYWVNESYDGKIDIYNSNGLKKRIIFPVKKYALTKDENMLMRAGRPGMFTMAGLNAKYRNFPKFHKAITKIEQMENEVWITIYKPEEVNKQLVYVFTLEGELKEILEFQKPKDYLWYNQYLKKGILYQIEKEPEEGWTIFKKYKLKYIKIN